METEKIEGFISHDDETLCKGYRRVCHMTSAHQIQTLSDRLNAPVERAPPPVIRETKSLPHSDSGRSKIRKRCEKALNTSPTYKRTFCSRKPRHNWTPVKLLLLGPDRLCLLSRLLADFDCVEVTLQNACWPLPRHPAIHSLLIPPQPTLGFDQRPVGVAPSRFVVAWRVATFERK